MVIPDLQKWGSNVKEPSRFTTKLLTLASFGNFQAVCLYRLLLTLQFIHTIISIGDIDGGNRWGGVIESFESRYRITLVIFGGELKISGCCTVSTSCREESSGHTH